MAEWLRREIRIGDISYGSRHNSPVPLWSRSPIHANGVGLSKVSAPDEFVKDQMVTNLQVTRWNRPCVFYLESIGRLCGRGHIVKWSASSLYAGGANTTVSAVYLLSLAMTLFPDVQKKAQAEIDANVSIGRLPSVTDRDSLPYTDALVKEVVRWNVVLPINMFMLNDPRTYADPSQSNPERFLARDRKEPEKSRTMYFGFDRRFLLRSICPGLHLADASIWISTAMSLAVFDISKVVENGVEITPEVEPLPGAVRFELTHPKPFKCSIKPRSAAALGLMEQDANY
ncbi:cytochrome P450 [Suillus bovinus]|uniref:cytochrome P450 n=1 Tax=Suillus bovinus TaxID=48563 RepID=UPI001B86E835|nr:cytochrome P450 [Suillus bovinus]KAG2136978.1 cytochrome P450 [Suillus bovinus]